MSRPEPCPEEAVLRPETSETSETSEVSMGSAGSALLDLEEAVLCTETSETSETSELTLTGSMGSALDSDDSDSQPSNSRFLNSSGFSPHRRSGFRTKRLTQPVRVGGAVFTLGRVAKDVYKIKFNEVSHEPPKLQNLDMSGEICALCQQDFEAKNGRLMILSCKHPYHKQCLDDHLRYRTTCPQCGKAVVRCESRSTTSSSEATKPPFKVYTITQTLNTTYTSSSSSSSS